MNLGKENIFYIAISLLTFIVFFVFRQFPESSSIFMLETAWMVLCIVGAVFFFDKSLINDTKKEMLKRSKKKLVVVIVLSCFLVAKIICSIYVRHIAKTLPAIETKQLIEYIILYYVAGIYEELLFKRGIYGTLCRILSYTALAMLLCSAIFFLFHFRFSFMSAFSLILYQLFTLALFRLYPNIATFGIFHALWNIALWI